MKPVILTTASKEFFENKGTDAYFLRNNYVKCIKEAGGVPIISCWSDPEQYASIADALILSGGDDIDPSFYGEKPIDNSNSVIQKERDQFEISLLFEFCKLGKPILGICRGMQVVNVAFGGTLWQDLPSQANAYHNNKHCHLVNAKSGSICEKLFGGMFNVNSFHHQAVKELGEGLIVDASGYSDNVIEAIKHRDKPIFAVQWHPEIMSEMKPIFSNFMNTVYSNINS